MSSFQIVVFLKQVADNTKLKFENGEPQLATAAMMLNPYDEYALETALRFKESAPNPEEAQLIAITVGTAASKEMLKKAVAVGADQAFIIQDDLLASKDSAAVSAVLAQAVKTLAPEAQVLLFGQAALDDAAGQTGPRVAELLNLPSLTYCKEATLSGSELTVSRETEQGVEVYAMNFPAVVCTIKCDYELRGSNIKGVMKANKTEIPIKTLADLQLNAADLDSPTQVTKTWQRPDKTGGKLLTGVDSQTAAKELVQYLKEHQLV